MIFFKICKNLWIIFPNTLHIPYSIVLFIYSIYFASSYTKVKIVFIFMFTCQIQSQIMVQYPAFFYTFSPSILKNFSSCFLFWMTMDLLSVFHTLFSFCRSSILSFYSHILFAFFNAHFKTIIQQIHLKLPPPLAFPPSLSQYSPPYHFPHTLFILPIQCLHFSIPF